MEPLLFLSHRLPFPPDKGDKVRSHHFLAHLARRYRVFLGAFVDERADWRHAGAARELCAGVHLERLRRWTGPARGAAALLRGEPLTLPWFRSRALGQWVDRVVRSAGISRAFVFSSSMAQYAIGRPGLRTVVDFVDMDSAKWAEYASRRRWPASLVFRREARRLLDYEKLVAADAAASLFVTEEETRRFLLAAPQCAPRVHTIRNGVDSDYYSPAQALASPFRAGERAVVFTGAMDYWPNVDAVAWFAHEVMPRLRREDVVDRFYVVGMNPGAAVRALAEHCATVITGRVPDVRPYLQHARAVVAPLRVARGIQNKVLEAMAMAKPVVASAACAAGIAARPGVELEVAHDAAQFADRLRALCDPARAARMGRLARERVLSEYTWNAAFRSLDRVLEGESPRAAEAAAR